MTFFVLLMTVEPITASVWHSFSTCFVLRMSFSASAYETLVVAATVSTFLTSANLVQPRYIALWFSPQFAHLTASCCNFLLQSSYACSPAHLGHRVDDRQLAFRCPNRKQLWHCFGSSMYGLVRYCRYRSLMTSGGFST